MEMRKYKHSRTRKQEKKTIKRRDNESHQRRERVLRDCMSDTENASERRQQQERRTIKRRDNESHQRRERSRTNTNYDK